MFGALTTATVWSATDTASSGTAAGVALVAWSLFSVVALHGLGRRSDRIIVVTPPGKAH